MNILLVEDDFNLSTIIKKFLIQKEYSVETASNGLIGLNKFVSNNFDLILLDINLPIINGIDLCKKIRSKNLLTPIIFITADKSDETMLKSYKLGINDYIKKPINTLELYLRISNIIEHKNNLLRKIVYNNFCIDLLNKIFYYNDKQIILTKKEYLIVEFFMKNKNKLFNTMEIYENIWDINDIPKSNLVNVHLEKIREKIVKYTSDNFIKSIKGFGYYIGDIKN